MALAGMGLVAPSAAAGTVADAAVYVESGAVQYTGGDLANDVIMDIDELWEQHTEFTIDDRVPIVAGQGCEHPDAADATLVVCTSSYVEPPVHVELGDGNDTLVVSGNVSGTATVHGGSGDDRIGAGGELHGDEGDDELVGYWGPDLLYGGDGDDRVEAGDGDDAVHGGRGHDDILAGLGDDLVHGNSGEDHVAGGKGGDQLSGGPDPDVIYGNSGDDHIRGGGGEDDLSGGPGTDDVAQ
ncbi:hypothetical protein [Streptomyces sp. B6B3]|uniref:calcium-binding protein n=1 Tax=Streptomyces sp. B6B3 TaxID=3153570 RepID=UPI00325DEE1F